MYSFFSSLWMLTLEMAPYLLLGFAIAGLLYAFVPSRAYRKYLSTPGTRSVMNATLLGIPLPLCSCGVLPTTVSLRRNGASRGACTAFLIATPQTGVDSILATYSLLGLPFAIIRPFAALVTGIVGGAVTDRVFRNETAEDINRQSPREEEEEKLSIFGKLRKAAIYAFGELLEDVGRWLAIGLFIAAAITVAVPNDFFSTLGDYPLLNMLIVLLIAIPMYVCATGSIPIALSLIIKGMSPGAAFVLLMAGPAVSAASMIVIDRTLGRRQTVIYIISIIAGALCFGLTIDYLLPPDWFTPSVLQGVTNCGGCKESVPGILESITAAVFVVLLLRALWRRTVEKKKCECRCECSEKKESDCLCESSNDHSPARHPAVDSWELQYFVDGMRCNRCADNLRESLSALPFVLEVEISLASGSVKLTINTTIEADKRLIEETIKKAGYRVRE